jgi:hypothetical protein
MQTLGITPAFQSGDERFYTTTMEERSMKKTLVNRRQSTKGSKTNCRGTNLRQLLRHYEPQRSEKSGGTSIVTMDADDPTLDQAQVVRCLGAHCDRGWVELQVEVRAKSDAVIISDPFDAVESREPMRKRLLDRREPNLGYGPLLRFLRTQVGKPWREVEAALHRRLGSNFASSYQTWDKVDFLVCKSVELRDGQVYDIERPWTSKLSRHSERFYIDPETGLLKKMPCPSDNKLIKKPRFEQVVISDRRRLIKVDGIWYRVDFEPIPTIDSLPKRTEKTPEVLRSLIGISSATLPPRGPDDILLKIEAVDDPSCSYSDRGSRGVKNWKLEPFVQEWGSKIYAARKQQANSDDLRKYGVK